MDLNSMINKVSSKSDIDGAPIRVSNKVNDFAVCNCVVCSPSCPKQSTKTSQLLFDYEGSIFRAGLAGDVNLASQFLKRNADPILLGCGALLAGKSNVLDIIRKTLPPVATLWQTVGAKSYICVIDYLAQNNRGILRHVLEGAIHHRQVFTIYYILYNPTWYLPGDKILIELTLKYDYSLLLYLFPFLERRLPIDATRSECWQVVFFLLNHGTKLNKIEDYQSFSNRVYYAKNIVGPSRIELIRGFHQLIPVVFFLRSIASSVSDWFTMIDVYGYEKHPLIHRTLLDRCLAAGDFYLVRQLLTRWSVDGRDLALSIYTNYVSSRKWEYDLLLVFCKDHYGQNFDFVITLILISARYSDDLLQLTLAIFQPPATISDPALNFVLRSKKEQTLYIMLQYCSPSNLLLASLQPFNKYQAVVDWIGMWYINNKHVPKLLIFTTQLHSDQLLPFLTKLIVGGKYRDIAYSISQQNKYRLCASIIQIMDLAINFQGDWEEISSIPTVEIPVVKELPILNTNPKPPRSFPWRPLRSGDEDGTPNGRNINDLLYYLERTTGQRYHYYP